MRHKTTNSGLLPNPPSGGIFVDFQPFSKEFQVPDYRFRQVLDSLQQVCEYFEDLNKLPNELRGKLVDRFGGSPLPLKPAFIHSAELVDKVVFETKSNAKIETVLVASPNP
jgi:23S rRNA (adenine-C8)-methyltransferase